MTQTKVHKMGILDRVKIVKILDMDESPFHHIGLSTKQCQNFVGKIGLITDTDPEDEDLFFVMIKMDGEILRDGRFDREELELV